MEIDKLVEKFLGGDRRALSRSMTLIQNDDPDSFVVLDKLYPNTGRAYRIGVTGPPGAGKSTLVDCLTKFLRKQDKSVGIIAVDPTSPFTGGALLGDRVRMNDIVLDPGVFIRSMATRGSLGGLTKNASDAADVLDAFGKDYVILETVGVGQSELDIVQTADTTVVVLVPESGDSIQAMKAGLMEIADVFVMNKADREGADNAMAEIKSMLHLRENKAWNPDILASVASEGRGIDEIAAKIEAHRTYLTESGVLEKKRKERLSNKVRAIVRDRFERAFWDDENRTALMNSLDKPAEKGVSPYKIAETLITNFKEKMETLNE